MSDDREGHWSAGALAYEEGSESTWDQGAHGMVGISGASAAAMGQEVPLSLDMRSLKRQKPRAPHDDAENVILRGAMGEPSYSVKENDGEIMEVRGMQSTCHVRASTHTCTLPASSCTHTHGREFSQGCCLLCPPHTTRRTVLYLGCNILPLANLLSLGLDLVCVIRSHALCPDLVTSTPRRSEKGKSSSSWA